PASASVSSPAPSDPTRITPPSATVSAAWAPAETLIRAALARLRRDPAPVTRILWPVVPLEPEVRAAPVITPPSATVREAPLAPTPTEIVELAVQTESAPVTVALVPPFVVMLRVRPPDCRAPPPETVRLVP